jgi:hypothetical protein
LHIIVYVLSCAIGANGSTEAKVFPEIEQEAKSISEHQNGLVNRVAVVIERPAESAVKLSTAYVSVSKPPALPKKEPTEVSSSSDYEDGRVVPNPNNPNNSNNPLAFILLIVS